MLWAAGAFLILVLSLLPKDLMISELPLSDKIAHFLAYGAVSWLGAMAASTSRRRLYLALAMLGLGVLLELAQTWVLGRTPEMLDGLANTLGVMVGVGLAMWSWSKEIHGKIEVGDKLVSRRKQE